MRAFFAIGFWAALVALCLYLGISTELEHRRRRDAIYQRLELSRQQLEESIRRLDEVEQTLDRFQRDLENERKRKRKANDKPLMT